MGRRYLPKCNLKLQHWHTNAKKITLYFKSDHKKSRCPLCRRFSRKIHSSYSRKLNDLPRSGRVVEIYLVVRRFFCENSCCKRKIFTERFAGTIQPWARKTDRYMRALKNIALSLGGEAGSRLSRELGMPTSPDTLLRLARNTDPVLLSGVRIIGVDDWAYKKGHRYGTIICDLEHGRPIDLLPDRSAKTLAQWLQKHPSIVIVSRDRAGVYADGVKQGAPQAIQVADRWHILKNLGEAVERFMQRQPLPKMQMEFQDKNENLPGKEGISKKTTRNERQKQERRNHKWKQVLEVKSLYKKGLSIREISRRLCFDRKTVRKYLALEDLPESTRCKRGSCLDPYKEYILNRLQEGCHNAMQLFREIREQGYPGGRTVVRDFVSQYRASVQGTKAKGRLISSREARRIIWKKRTEITEKEQQVLDTLLKISDEYNRIYALVQSFQEIMDKRQSTQLESWLQEAEECGIVEIRRFALGIRRDFEAVHASLCYEWSNGLVEGHIHRLKLIKRQMYGRANFDLLRNRVLYNN